MSKELTIQSLLPAVRKPKEISSSEARTFIGIDFGTSTSVVSFAVLDPLKTIDVKAVWVDQPNSDGIGKMSSEKVPTVVAWHRNKLLIGKGAADLKYSKKRGVDVWYSFKMELGEDLGPKYYNSAVQAIRRPSDAATVFFRYLKSEIERFVQDNKMPQAIEYAVSIPASFEANQRKDLIGALAAAGINVGSQSLIDEPNAAFLSYVVETNTDRTTEKLLVPADYPLHILVFDFGAGTCDISILEVGQDRDGLYSKNISISRFEKLGGDDIDRLIARKILFEQLMSENNVKETDFKTPQINKGIIPKLMKPAEELKIQICQAVALQYRIGENLPGLALSETGISLGITSEIDLPKHRLLLKKPSLTYAQFKEVMDIFLATKKEPHPEYEDQAEFISIFNPIESALKKANLDKQDGIDYVLLVGGSSKNPYVQDALSRFFNQAEILLPRDLQTQVSTGAAIHSLIYKGFGKNIIQPITSEPIMVVTEGAALHTLVRAGTEIPSDIFEIDDLVTQREGQRKIEIPICVSSEDKILHVATIESRDDIPVGTPIKIKCQITADKLFLMQATVEDKIYRVQPLNPLANRPLDYYERRIYEAERLTNIDAEKNNGIPGKRSLIHLTQAYAEAKKHLRAAETMETSNELHPGSVSPGSIAFHYSRAGNREKALAYYEKDYKANRSAHSAFNLAVTIGWDNPDRYQKLMEEALRMESRHPYSLYCYGEFLMLRLKDEKRGRELVKKAFDIFKGWFDHDNLDDDDYVRLIKCANLLDDADTARKVKEKLPIDGNKPYINENLLHHKDATALTRKG